jgi:hypothetical protein
MSSSSPLRPLMRYIESLDHLLVKLIYQPKEGDICPWDSEISPLYGLDHRLRWCEQCDVYRSPFHIDWPRIDAYEKLFREASNNNE